MLHENRARASSFGNDAEQYDRARPTYPDAMIDDLMADSPATVLDVGCGTGKAGTLFMARGCAVTGVEPDERMAEIARRHGMVVEVGDTFEEWNARGRHFDLITAGDSWHWVDPDVGIPKARAALEPTGRFAAFWNLGEHDIELEQVLQEVFRRVVPDRAESFVANAPLRELTEDADKHFGRTVGLFETPELSSYTWDLDYQIDEWLEKLASHSNFRVLPPEVRERLLEELGRVASERGDVVTSHFTTWMVTARAC